MSHYYAIPVVDTAELSAAQHAIGPEFARIIGYFQEDGIKAIIDIEKAMHARSAATMVLPAHKLKGEARQLGATRLGEIAESIEKTARSCIEKQTTPEDIAAEVAMLRGCFTETMQKLSGGQAMGQSALPPPAAPAHQAQWTPPSAPVRAPGSRPATFGRRVN